MSSRPLVKILLLGAGELGTSFLQNLTLLPSVQITLGVRNPSNYSHLITPTPNTTIITLDTTSPSAQLSQTFSHYDILISATGFAQPPGTLTKLATEVLLAGQLKKDRGEEGKLWFFPWQWGVDYDITGDGQGLMPLFGEQKAIRDLLRSEAEEKNVKWTIVSTGIFMSFLFEQFWGIVDRQSQGEGGITVRCLKDWDHRVTVTDVHDIGRVLVRIVAGDVDAEDKVVYVAGDTVSYGELAGIVEKVSGRKVERETWNLEYLEKELSQDPENELRKYRLVFAREGVWWDKEKSVNAQLGMEMMSVESYARKLFEK